MDVLIRGNRLPYLAYIAVRPYILGRYHCIVCIREGIARVDRGVVGELHRPLIPGSCDIPALDGVSVHTGTTNAGYRISCKKSFRTDSSNCLDERHGFDDLRSRKCLAHNSKSILKRSKGSIPFHHRRKTSGFPFQKNGMLSKRLAAAWTPDPLCNHSITI
jgi:hypothetical protein